MQIFARVIHEYGIIVSDERGSLADADHDKLTVMPRHIKSSDFHHGYKVHQTKTAKGKVYKTS